MKKSLLLFWILSCSGNLEQYESYKTPQINTYPDEFMLVYTITGDPDETAGEAIGALMHTFYKLKGKYDLKSAPPRARWPKTLETPRNEWVGIFGIPVKAALTEIPADILEKYPLLSLETWKYGEMAEILHIGDYDDEPPTVKRLKEFIQESGYVYHPPHEEIYLKGPGMFGKGNPDKYQTLIRYRVSMR